MLTSDNLKGIIEMQAYKGHYGVHKPHIVALATQLGYDKYVRHLSQMNQQFYTDTRTCVDAIMFGLYVEQEITKWIPMHKILILGSRGSGKSTLLKQLRLIYDKGFDDNDKLNSLKHIHSQIISDMKKALQVYIGYNQRLQQKENKSDEDEWKNEW
eukprot:310020_1